MNATIQVSRVDPGISRVDPGIPESFPGISGNVSDGMLRVLAESFGRRLSEQSETAKAKDVSVYWGKGESRILIKFRLNRFEELRGVYEAFLAASVELQMREMRITSATYAELDERGEPESDDGSIIAEVNKLVGQED